MTTVTIIFLITFAGAVLLAPFYIPLLRRLKFGQTIRYNGPQSHRRIDFPDAADYRSAGFVFQRHGAENDSLTVDFGWIWLCRVSG